MSFTAADTFTRADYLRSDGLSGSGLASWLLGTPTSGSVNINMFPIYLYPYMAPWAQYDWKVSRKLWTQALRSMMAPVSQPKAIVLKL